MEFPVDLHTGAARDSHSPAAVSTAHGRRSAVRCRLFVLFCGLFLSCLLSTLSAAQSLKLRVLPKSGTLQDSFQFDVRVEGGSQTDQPTLSGGDDFSVTFAGPSQSVRIINGTVTSEVVFHYRLFPKRSGTLRTPSVEVLAGNRRLVAQPLEIEVANAQPPDTGQPSNNRALYLEQRLDREEVFVGQQVVATLELFTATHLREPRFGDLTFDGFWTETLGDEQQGTRMVQGKQYTVIRTRKSIYPLSPGDKVLAPRELKTYALVRKPRAQRPVDPFDPFRFDQDFFDQFFGLQEFQETVVRSNESRLKVLPLPAPPPTATHWNPRNPLVGATSLTASSSESIGSTVNVGDALTITLKLESEGNLNPIGSLPVAESPLYRLYAERPEQQSDEIQGRRLSTKTFRYSLIPLQPGVLELPPVRLTYFDPEEKIYRDAATAHLSFNVIGSPAAPVATLPPAVLPTRRAASTAAAAPSAPEPAGTTPAAPDAVPWGAGMFDSLTAKIAPEAFVFVGILLVAIFAVVALVASVVRRRAPLARVLRRVAVAHDVAVLREILLSHLAGRHLVDARAMTNDELRERLRTAIQDSTLRFHTIALLERMNQATFGGQQMTQSEFDRLREDLREIIKALDRV